MAVLVALGVAASYMIPLLFFGAKLFPAQAAINVIGGVLLGPWLSGVVALTIAIIRILLGTGSPLAIPGSIFGAMLAGLLYRWTRSYLGAMAGEVIGTGVVGALAAYPIAVLIMRNAAAATAGATVYMVSFSLSSLAGSLLAGAILPVLGRVARPQE